MPHLKMTDHQSCLFEYSSEFAWYRIKDDETGKGLRSLEIRNKKGERLIVDDIENAKGILIALKSFVGDAELYEMHVAKREKHA